MKRSLVTVTLVLLLSGCIRSVSPDFELKPDSSRGVIVVSLTASGRIPGELLFYVRPQGDTASLQGRSIQVFGPTKGIVDWPILKSGNPPDQPPGRLAILELAPGQYEFYRWSGIVGGFVQQNVKPFSYRFEVRPGEVVYLGTLHLNRPNDQKYTVTTGDRRDRDFPLLEKKLPNVPPEKIATRLLN
jgi:hypothetical protein